MKMIEQKHAPLRKRYPTFLEYLKNEYAGLYGATDGIIWHDDGNKDGLSLILRGNYPHGFALAGGISELMTFQENFGKESREELSLKVVPDPQFLFRPIVFSDPKQDPRAPIAAITYVGRGYGRLEAGDDAKDKSAKVYTLDEIVELLKRPVGKGDEDAENCWAYIHHKRALAVYILGIADGQWKSLGKDEWKPKPEKLTHLRNMIRKYQSKLLQKIEEKTRGEI